MVLFLGIPNKEDIVKKENVDDSQLITTSLSADEAENRDVLLKFDIVRLDPSGDLIIAGKTEPNIVVDIYDGNQKLTSVLSDTHGDWVWVSEKKIDNGLKRFNLKHSDSEGKIINSDENIIIFFEKNEKQKVVKIRDKSKYQ